MTALTGPAVFLAPDRHAYLVLGMGAEPVLTWSDDYETAEESARIHAAVVVAVPILADHRHGGGPYGQIGSYWLACEHRPNPRRVYLESCQECEPAAEPPAEPDVVPFRVEPAPEDQTAPALRSGWWGLSNEPEPSQGAIFTDRLPLDDDQCDLIAQGLAQLRDDDSTVLVDRAPYVIRQD